MLCSGLLLYHVWSTQWGLTLSYSIRNLAAHRFSKGLVPYSTMRIPEQMWHNVKWTLSNTLWWYLNQNIKFFVWQNVFENVVCKIVAILLKAQCINSLRLRNTYMHQWTMPSLVQIMACHLVCVKLLSKPMLEYFQLDPLKHISVKLYSKFQYFHSRKCRLRNGGHFVSASMC